MDKVIPILPCPDVKAQVAFYEQLGFELLTLETAPAPYAALKFRDFELHFWRNSKMDPAANATMCFIQVPDVDEVHNIFVGNLKRQTGKVPRSGIPRITKVRDLKSDRRFTLTDPGGNTLFIGTPLTGEGHLFFRTIQDAELASRFTVLYDLVYSKEDCAMAAKLLPRLMQDRERLNDLDRAKLLLVALEIHRQLGQPADGDELKALIETEGGSSDWQKVKQRHASILKDI